MEYKKDEPIGNDPTTGLPIFVLNGRFGPYVQLGVKLPKEKKKRNKAEKEKKTTKKKMGDNTEKNKVAGAVDASNDLQKNDKNLVNFLKGEKEGMTATQNSEMNTSSAASAIKPVKPKMASIPKTMDPSKVTVAEALKYLSLPRLLGIDPATGKDITASIGRFGPYIVRDGDFRSLKGIDNPYDIALERALELLAIAKKPRGFAKKNKADN
jgi:DNA topoisomerase-1